jgi:hypothetical protein
MFHSFSNACNRRGVTNGFPLDEAGGSSHFHSRRVLRNCPLSILKTTVVRMKTDICNSFVTDFFLDIRAFEIVYD